MNIKLIVSDIDGTLLLNGATRISEEIFQLIHRLKEKGILFVAASGRQYKNLQQLFYPIKDDIAYICENGGVCIYQNRAICEKILPPDLAFKICEDIFNHKDCELQISTTEIQYLKPKSPAFLAMMQKEIGLKIETIDNLKDVTAPILKIAMYHKGGINDANYWQQQYGDSCAIQYGRYDWMDFAPLKTNKGSTLVALQQHLKLKKEQCIAFGDYYNDISMLEAVGTPIVMDSAPEDMQKLAHRTTPTVADELHKILDSLK